MVLRYQEGHHHCTVSETASDLLVLCQPACAGQAWFSPCGGASKLLSYLSVSLQTLERIPKMSANWYAEVIKKNRLEMI